MLLLFSYLLFSALDLMLSCTHCLYARALLFSYTLIRSLLMILDLHVKILDALLYCSGVRWARTLCEDLGFSLLDYRYSCSFIHVISWFSL